MIELIFVCQYPWWYNLLNLITYLEQEYTTFGLNDIAHVLTFNKCAILPFPPFLEITCKVMYVWDEILKDLLVLLLS